MNPLLTLHVRFLEEKFKPWPFSREYYNASDKDFLVKSTFSVEVFNIACYTLREMCNSRFSSSPSGIEQMFQKRACLY